MVLKTQHCSNTVLYSEKAWLMRKNPLKSDFRHILHFSLLVLSSKSFNKNSEFGTLFRLLTHCLGGIAQQPFFQKTVLKRNDELLPTELIGACDC